jgi:hypothetical protein
VNPGSTVVLNGSTATGGTLASYVYQWQQSFDGKNWVNCKNGNGLNYTSDAVYRTTYFRRIVTNDLQTGLSIVYNIKNIIQVRVIPSTEILNIPNSSTSYPDSTIKPVPIVSYSLSGLSPDRVNYLRTWSLKKPGVNNLNQIKTLSNPQDIE